MDKATLDHRFIAYLQSPPICYSGHLAPKPSIFTLYLGWAALPDPSFIPDVGEHC